MHYFNVKELQEKIDKALEKGEAVSEYIVAVKDNVEELKLCKEISKSPKRLRGDKLKVFSILIDETINELHDKIKEFFATKQVVSVEKALEEEESRFEEFEDDDEDEDEDLEGLESLLPLNEIWSDEVIKKARREVELAQARRELARKEHKRGAKVKRVPPKKEFDAADVAAELGMEDLAKELTIERPKPFVTTKKEGPVTKREYFVKSTSDIDDENRDLKELLEKAFNKESEDEDTSKKLKAVLDYEKHKKTKAEDVGRDYRFARVPQNEAASAFSEEYVDGNNSLAVVEHLEKLVGQFTTEKLAAERKLALAQRALKEANNNLNNSNVEEIMGVPKTTPRESLTDKLKRDFEEAFKERRF